MENRSYIEWGTVIAGAVVALAISTVLLQFGAVVGFAQISPALSADANISPGFVLGTGIWLLWVQVLASLTGGYLAGRMRTPIVDLGATAHESDLRDGVHGLLVWALSTVVVVVAVGFVSSIAALTDNPVEDAKRIADLSVASKNATVIFAFFAGATSLVSGVISWAAATAGGNHRDSRADHTKYFTFRA
jgi:hypothetical protein